MGQVVIWVLYLPGSRLPPLCPPCHSFVSIPQSVLTKSGTTSKHALPSAHLISLLAAGVQRRFGSGTVPTRPRSRRSLSQQVWMVDVPIGAARQVPGAMVGNRPCHDRACPEEWPPVICRMSPPPALIGGLFALPLLAVDLALVQERPAARGEDVVQPQAVVLWEGQQAVVPPGIQSALGVLLPMNVNQAPGQKLFQGGTARRMVQDRLFPGRRIGNIQFVPGHVEVAAEDQGRLGREVSSPGRPAAAAASRACRRSAPSRRPGRWERRR